LLSLALDRPAGWLAAAVACWLAATVAWLAGCHSGPHFEFT